MKIVWKIYKILVKSSLVKFISDSNCKLKKKQNDGIYFFYWSKPEAVVLEHVLVYDYQQRLDILKFRLKLGCLAIIFLQALSQGMQMKLKLY